MSEPQATPADAAPAAPLLSTIPVTPGAPPTPEHKRCTGYLNYAMNRSPFVKFMLDALKVRMPTCTSAD